MHPFVNLNTALAGRLELPAAERKNLAPKVAIGSQWKPREREFLDHRGGIYLGKNPSMDSDALNVQAAMLRPSLCEYTPKQPSRRPRKLVEAGWWMLGGALLATLIVLCCAMAAVPTY